MTAIPGAEQPANVPETPSGNAPAAERRFLRSRRNRVLAGVCGGIAEYYGSDVTAVRLLTVLLAVFTGFVPLLFVYLVVAIVVPDHAEGAPVIDSTNAAGSPARGAGLVLGLALIAFGVVALANELLHVDWDVLWPVVLIVLGGGFFMAAAGRR